MISSNRSSISRRDMPCRPAVRYTLSRTLRSSTNPPVISMSGATPARTATLPSSGSTTSATSLSSVDLPWPFRPTTPMASPGWTLNETLRRAQNSSGRSRRSWPPKRSLKVRRPRRLRRNRMPASRTSMTGPAPDTPVPAAARTSLVTSDLLQHGTLGAGEDGEADPEQREGHHRAHADQVPVELRLEEARAVEAEQSAQGVQGRPEVGAARQIAGAVDDRAGIEQEAKDQLHRSLEVA